MTGAKAASAGETTVLKQSAVSLDARLPSEDAQLPQVSELAVLLAVGLGTTLAPLNSTMIAVALPRILDEFHVGVAGSAWLVTAYLVAMAVLQPLAGSLGDRFGRRQLMLGGLIWFGLASLGAVVAGSFEVLAACRIQQGIAGAIALPNGMALARRVLPAARRARGFAMLGTLTGLAAALGPPLGGVIETTAGWRAMFLTNVPLVGAALLLSWRALPAMAVSPASGTRTRKAGGRGWLPRLRHPRTFASAAAAVCLSNLAFYVTLLALPLLLSFQPGWTSAHNGGVLAVLLGTSLCATPVGGFLADRLGRRLPTVAGLLVCTAGLGALAWLAIGAGDGGALPVPALIASLAVAGAGIGLSGPGMTTAGIEAAGPEDAGAAAGLYSTSRYLGSITGSAALVALSGTGAARAAPHLDAVFGLIVASAFLSALVSLGLNDHAGTDHGGMDHGGMDHTGMGGAPG